MQANKFDSKGKCLLHGNKAEQEFKKLAELKGWHVEPSDYKGNAIEKWDFKVTKGDKQFRIEVKSIKKKSRGNQNVQDTWTWVEFKNIKGGTGWLYGKSDLVAFQCDDYFLIVKRKDLTKLAEKLVDLNIKHVKKSSLAKYKPYHRETRPNELTSMIETKHILALDNVHKWNR